MDTQTEMQVEAVKEDDRRLTVVTTGAEYVIHRSGKNGRVDCHQRLNKQRLIGTVEFDCSFSTVSVERYDTTTCVLHQQLGKGLSCDYLRLQINADSVVDVLSTRALDVDVRGNLRPDYGAEKDGNVLLLDEYGGSGFYPCRGLNTAELSELACKEWRIHCSLIGAWRLLMGVFPPRRFNLAQSFDERIVHHGSIGPWVVPPFPSDAEIESASQYANVLVLHEGIWQGKLTRKGKRIETPEDIYAEAAYSCFDYVPVDEKDLTRVVKKAHALGMNVIPYMSPFYSTAKRADFLARVKETLQKYEMDGVYYDGISSDVLDSYQMIRETRSLLGDKILYVHCTSDPLGSQNIYCPFIDTYADYILRAEHATRLTDRYLRYVISGHNISNAIGYVCYYDLPLDTIGALIDKALDVHARFYLGSPETERERLLKKEYFPRLQGLR